MRSEKFAAATPDQLTVAIGKLRRIALNSGKLAGIEGPEFLDVETSTWSNVWMYPERPPIAARVTVKRSDVTDALPTGVLLAEWFVESDAWHEQPVTMLGGMAEIAAIARAFAIDLDGRLIRRER